MVVFLLLNFLNYMQVRVPNLIGERIPAVSNLNIPSWRQQLCDYLALYLCDWWI